MEILTLPGPAGELWAAKREVIHSLPAEVFGQPIRPHIGGGTTLAARWKHRLSTDIDILLPGRNTLIDLLQDDERNVVRRLGGEPEAVTDRRAKIAFTRGKIDLCILKPDPAQGHAEASVDGEKEIVLTSAQILRGKLQRPERLLVRDVFDIVTAAKADPGAISDHSGCHQQPDSLSANPSRVGRRAAAGRRCGGQHPGLRHASPERGAPSPVARLKRAAACG